MKRPNGQVAEPPLTIDTREELVYLLGEACGIEHGLMCEYLYAQFSLKRGLDEGLTPEQLGRFQAWEKTLIDVIKQEMLHLALATNILTAVGAAPHFERPNFPSSPAGTPTAFRLPWSASGSAPCVTSCTSNARRGWPSTTPRGSGRSSTCARSRSTINR